METVSTERLRQAFRKMREEQERDDMTALAYYPHITKLFRDAENLPEATIARFAKILTELIARRET